jgi:ABC-2 type transport system permease protein
MNAVVLRTLHASDDTMPRHRLVRAYAKELTYECLRMLRSPAFAIPTLAFPTFFYVLIGFLFGAFKATDPNAQAYVFLGFATMAAMTPGMFSFGVGLATEREQGLHRLKRALPMPTGAAVFAKIALCLLSVMAAVAILALAGLALGTIQLAPTTLLALAGLLAIGAVPFCALGLMLGAFAGARGAAPLVNVTYMLMLYLSGLFMPLPEAIAKIVVVSPAFYLHQLALHVAHVPNALVGGVPAHVGVLAAMTVLFTTVAVRRFERAD